MNKLEKEDRFELYLSCQLTVDDDTTDFQILTAATVPIPACNEVSDFHFPGDGSIEGFVEILGHNIGQTAVDQVLTYLGLKVTFSNSFS